MGKLREYTGADASRKARCDNVSCRAWIERGEPRWWLAPAQQGGKSSTYCEVCGGTLDRTGKLPVQGPTSAAYSKALDKAPPASPPKVASPVSKPANAPAPELSGATSVGAQTPAHDSAKGEAGVPEKHVTEGQKAPIPNPASMDTSGIVWLGPVPIVWAVRRSEYGRIEEGATLPTTPDKLEEAMPRVRKVVRENFEREVAGKA